MDLNNMGLLSVGTLCVFFFVTLTLGLELLFDFLGFSRRRPTPAMRIGGIVMLMESASILFYPLLPLVIGDTIILHFFARFIDVYILIVALFICQALIENRWPRLKLVAYYTLPQTLMVLADVLWPDLLAIWYSGIKIWTLLCFIQMGVKTWRYNRRLFMFYSNVEMRGAAWFAIYYVWMLICMVLYDYFFVHTANDYNDDCIYYILSIGMYIFLFRNLMMQRPSRNPKLPSDGPLSLKVPADGSAEAESVESAADSVTTEEDSVTTEADVAATDNAGEDGGVEERGKAERTPMPTAEETKVATRPTADDSTIAIAALQGERGQRMFEALERLMKEEKVYRNAQLSIDDLVKDLATNTTYFYYFMRDIVHMRFYDYVNGYRIDAAKRLLLESDYSTEAIADECGFSSATNFGRVFRKYTGLSPMKWKKENR